MTSARHPRFAPASMVLAASAIAGLVTGCAGPSDSDVQAVTDWIADQPHVTAVQSAVDDDPWSRSVSLSIEVEAGISDDDLRRLAPAAARRAANLPDPYLVWQVGEGHSFSNLGGAATLEVFLGLRHDSRYEVVSARGGSDCSGFFCVVLDDDDPAVLLDQVDRMLALAQRAGGVQPNLPFEAQSADGRFVVGAQPEAPVDEAVALLTTIAARVPVEHARVTPIEAVGDIPSAQLLDLWVSDEQGRLVAQQIADRQSLVEVSVWNADGEADAGTGGGGLLGGGGGLGGSAGPTFTTGTPAP